MEAIIITSIICTTLIILVALSLKNDKRKDTSVKQIFKGNPRD